MSQVFDPLKPISGTTKLSQLYQIIRDHNDANRSNFSGAAAPANPVVGQLWEDTGNDKLFLYTASGWSEITVANSGLGLEIINARGSLASLDQRFDVSQNEDGTLKASTSLNPSQWYTNTVASGIASSTSFISYGSNMTTTYHPLRRLKINRSGGTFFTEVVSSSYGGGNTTVVVRDAVIIATLISVEHSIVAPRKATAGDGSVSYEMIANKQVAQPTTTYTVLIGDSVILADGTFTITGIDSTLFGPGRDLFIKNIGTGVITFTPTVLLDGSYASLTLKANQSLHILAHAGAGWKRLDTFIETEWTNWSANASPQGWSGTPTVYVFYLKIGKLIFISFNISGTSSAFTASITLPFATVNSLYALPRSSFRAKNAGVDGAIPGMAYAVQNSSVLNFYKDWAQTAWSNSGTKEVDGQLVYMCQ